MSETDILNIALQEFSGVVTQAFMSCMKALHELKISTIADCMKNSKHSKYATLAYKAKTTRKRQKNWYKLMDFDKPVNLKEE